MDDTSLKLDGGRQFGWLILLARCGAPVKYGCCYLKRRVPVAEDPAAAFYPNCHTSSTADRAACTPTIPETTQLPNLHGGRKQPGRFRMLVRITWQRAYPSHASRQGSGSGSAFGKSGTG